MTRTIPARPYRQDLSGLTFGSLTVLWETIPHRCPNGCLRRKWLCECSCGELVRAAQHDLMRDRIKQCRLCRRKVMAKLATTHGGVGTAEYRAWQEMWRRCTDPTRDSYKDYGERGIRVCARWESFVAFRDDMGPKPAPEYSLDRMDNNGNYEPGNCRWATDDQQRRNRRNTWLIEFRGQTLPAVEWCERIGISLSAVWHRVRRLGWTTEEALSTPLRADSRRTKDKTNAV